MATRANIMITSDWRNFATAYCHWDGGLWYVGKVLNEHYNDTDTILDLVALGDMSSLKETVEETATDEGNVYKESGGKVEMKTEENVFIPSCGEEYLYVWDANQEIWFVGTYYTSTPNFRLLEQALKSFSNGFDEKGIFGEDYTGEVFYEAEAA
tara:strand:+ start:276 stop:737 length:462 start_codon:yes stop_codon:yes gene_type:complete